MHAFRLLAAVLLGESRNTKCSVQTSQLSTPPQEGALQSFASAQDMSAKQQITEDRTGLNSVLYPVALGKDGVLQRVRRLPPSPRLSVVIRQRKPD